MPAGGFHIRAGVQRLRGVEFPELDGLPEERAPAHLGAAGLHRVHGLGRLRELGCILGGLFLGLLLGRGLLACRLQVRLDLGAGGTFPCGLFLCGLFRLVGHRALGGLVEFFLCANRFLALGGLELGDRLVEDCLGLFPVLAGPVVLVDDLLKLAIEFGLLLVRVVGVLVFGLLLQFVDGIAAALVLGLRVREFLHDLVRAFSSLLVEVFFKLAHVDYRVVACLGRLLL